MTCTEQINAAVISCKRKKTVDIKFRDCYHNVLSETMQKIHGKSP